MYKNKKKTANNRNVEKQPEKTTISFKYWTTRLVFALVLSTLERNVIIPFQIFNGICLIKYKIILVNFHPLSRNYNSNKNFTEKERSSYVSSVYVCHFSRRKHYFIDYLAQCMNEFGDHCYCVMLKFRSNWFRERDYFVGEIVDFFSSYLSTCKIKCKTKQKRVISSWFMYTISTLTLLVLKQLWTNKDVLDKKWS